MEITGRNDRLCQTMDPHAADWAALLEGRGTTLPELGLYAALRTASGPDGGFVLGRIAQTLDGRIATTNGASFWISGPDDIRHTHRLRALFDAIVVGAGTVRADDPLLTTRICAGPSPVRVILDPERRLHAGHRVFQGPPRTLLMVAADRVGPANIGPARTVPARNVSARLGEAECIAVPRNAEGTGLDLACVLAELRDRGLARVFIEGGGVTVSRFLAAGLLDRLHVTVAPLLLGSGIPSFTLPQAMRPDQGLRLDWTLHQLGADVLFDIRIDRARPPSCGAA
jgi:riboflavin-specific deaminase-like protein